MGKLSHTVFIYAWKFVHFGNFKVKPVKTSAAGGQDQNNPQWFDAVWNRHISKTWICFSWAWEQVRERASECMTASACESVASVASSASKYVSAWANGPVRVDFIVIHPTRQFCDTCVWKITLEKDLLIYKMILLWTYRYEETSDKDDSF